ncbi:GNAT family N-acetyltransferase [Tsukamurella tyrosinosolvens]|uniref:GNAT family N-acetyltransferase n=1 Tax=Tsukamurella tyrosinosolvens TaxID=57704 RepID=UPI002DD42149|nr:GNAT family protein [Tsukamurella tyrosinosolvens]MEC4613029.1 GNAT family protein [Tsukamurella tyrosinosolvens]
MTSSTTVRVVPATATQLEALHREPAEFERLIGAPIPDGWPEFPEAIEHTLAVLRNGVPAEWSMYLFFSEEGDLVGSGGYHGPPVGGTVEIGYEIAPEHRGRGLAVGAARALAARALAAGAERIVAHTLAAPSPSTGVLAALGFERADEVVESEDGPLWAWLLVPARSPA